MSAVKAGAAFVELVVQDDKLRAGLRAASAKIKKWAQDTQKYMKSIGKSLMGFGTKGLALGGAIGGGLMAMAKSFADTGDAIEKMSHRTGMSAESLSELGYAAKQCGTDIGAIEAGTRKMQTLMLEAGRGSQAAADKLAALGLSYKQLAKLSPEDQFMAIIDRLGQMDEASRAAHAMNVLGKSASALMPLINAGSGGIAELRAEAKKLGVSMSTADAQGAAALADAMTRLQTSMKSIVNAIGAALAPEIKKLSHWLLQSTQYIIDMVNNNRQLIVTILKVAAVIAGVGAGLIATGMAFMAIGAAASGFGMIAGAVITGITVGLKIIIALLGFLISPLGLICVAAAGLLWYFGAMAKATKSLQGAWASLTSFMMKSWGAVQNALAAGRFDLVMKVAWSAVKLIWASGVNFLLKMWYGFADKVGEAWDATIWAFRTGWIAFKRGGVDIFVGVLSAWLNFTNKVRSMWATCINYFLDAWDTASTAVAKGLAWVQAKLTGQNAAEMVRLVEEEHVERKKGRNAKHAAEQSQRNTQLEKEKAALGKDAYDSLDKQQKDADDAYINKQNARHAKYAALEESQSQAGKEFDDAVAEAAAARAESIGPVRVPLKIDPGDIEEYAFEAGEGASREIKSSSSSGGTFSAAAMQSLQSNSAMDNIDKNTEASAKYLQKIYQDKITAAAG